MFRDHARAHWRVAVPDDPARWPDDAALVKAVVAGDPAATTHLWARFLPPVFKVVCRMLGSERDAEDVTQEVFAWVFRRLSTLRDPAALRAFIISFAVRIAKWELRRRRVRRVLRLSWTGALPDIPEDDGDTARQESAYHLYAVLDRLSARERIALVLRHAEGMTIEEMAAAMDLSIATVKRVLKGAATRFHELAEGEPVLCARIGGQDEA